MLKEDILRKDKDFQALYKKGRSGSSKYVVIFYKRNGTSENRKAVLASKKVGNSVERNRARRLMKESFRKMENELKQGYDILFIARNTITSDNAKCQDVEKAMKTLLKKADLLI